MQRHQSPVERGPARSLDQLGDVYLRRRRGERLGEEIALIIEGMYLSAAHLGSSGPARRGRALIMRLLTEADHVR